MILIQGMIGITGKRTFRNLARYMQIAEHTFSRQMAKSFDFIGLNAAMIKSSKSDGDVLIAAQDGSFIEKSGKKTYGLDYFWNGSHSKIDKGLEIDVIAVIKVGNARAGYAISSEQVPANPILKADRKKKKLTDFSKIDFCLGHVKKVLPQLKDLNIKHIAADAFFAKIKYVNGVVELGLNVISKLRKDARLRRLYIGPQKNRGRKKIFDTGKVNVEDFEKSLVTKVEDKNIELRSCIAYSESLKCTIKVVLARKQISANKYCEALLFSTDLELDAATIYEFYVSRFQIEFVFRDAKGFTGLSDCQSRDSKRLHYHFNASITALNVAKIQDAESQKANNERRPFSMMSLSRKLNVEIVINRFFSMSGFDQTLIKSNPDFNNLLSFGRIEYRC